MAAFVTLLLLISPQLPLLPRAEMPTVTFEAESLPPAIAFDAPPRPYQPLIRR